MRSSLVVVVAIAVAVVVLVPRAARAGACLTAQEDEEDLKQLEAFAAAKTKPKTNDEGWLCVDLSVGADELVDGTTGDYDKKLAVKLRRRAVAACTKVIDRDGVSGPCVVILAAARLSKVGTHDLFPAVAKLAEDPIDTTGGVGWTKTALFGRMGDPRGEAAVIEMWKTAIPRADAREKKHYEMRSWSAWRQTAAGVLGVLGGADDKAFLEEQATATKDTHVAQACRDAEAAITKRLAAP